MNKNNKINYLNKEIIFVSIDIKIRRKRKVKAKAKRIRIRGKGIKVQKGIIMIVNSQFDIYQQIIQLFSKSLIMFILIIFANSIFIQIGIT